MNKLIFSDDAIFLTDFLFSGITLIGHNSESAMNVGHCLDPGCYTRSIAYEASSRQISALIELSNECRQSIKVLFLSHHKFYNSLLSNDLDYDY